MEDFEDVPTVALPPRPLFPHGKVVTTAGRPVHQRGARIETNIEEAEGIEQ